MGFGDLYHEHPLQFYNLHVKGSNCSRCEMAITTGKSYGCSPCNYFVHKVCAELPQKMWHPSHSQHPLIFGAPLLSSSSDPFMKTNLCNKCHEPCLGYTYNCPTCQFNLHLNCFLAYEYQYLDHPLSLLNFQGLNIGEYKCSACGFIVVGYSFACKACKIYLHHDCSFLPQTIKSHHVHELAFNYGFPKESKQFYCDMCEDRDGKELDLSASYYYCKQCDYIAHVHCVVKPEKIEIERYIHDKCPLSYSEKPPHYYRHNNCQVCHDSVTDINYHCNKCDWVVHESCAKIPPSIRHAAHEQHDLVYCATIPDQATTCNLCGGHVRGPSYKCAVCEYSTHITCGRHLRHPSHYKHELIFEIESQYRRGDVDGSFRCDACGFLGNGLNLRCMTPGCNFDLHLECSLLPMTIQHESHQHPLTLNFPKFGIENSHSLPDSPPICCIVCGDEVNPRLWSYNCKECDNVAHLMCVSSNSLLNSQTSSIDFPNFHNILRSLETFPTDGSEPQQDLHCNNIIPYWEDKLAWEDNEPRPLCLYSIPEIKMLRAPLFGTPDDNYRQMGTPSSYPGVQIMQTDDEITSILEDPGKLRYSNHDHPLTILEKDFKGKRCYVCDQKLFNPAFSCTECKFYLHKSCSELPLTFVSHKGHKHELVATPLNNGLSTCSFCEKELKACAYYCTTCSQFALHARCAFMAPIMKHKFHEHFLTYFYREFRECKACGNEHRDFSCSQPSCSFTIHKECASLPHTIMHGIHQHPLELAPDLAALGDDYICDACEKDLNPNLWAYRCVEDCGGRATSHVTCVIDSNKKYHFSYEVECRGSSTAGDSWHV